MILMVQSIAAPTNWFMFLLVLLSVAILTGLMIAYNRYSRTGGNYDPAILLRKYGLVVVLLLVIGFGYINLDYYFTFKASTDKTSYSVGEIVEVNCSIVNPLPLPVYYRGYSRITTEMRYLNGSKVNRTDLPLMEASAADAAEAARAA